MSGRSYVPESIDDDLGLFFVESELDPARVSKIPGIGFNQLRHSALGKKGIPQRSQLEPWAIICYDCAKQAARREGFFPNILRILLYSTVDYAADLLAIAAMELVNALDNGILFSPANPLTARDTSPPNLFMNPSGDRRG